MASPEEKSDVNKSEEDQPGEERISITINISLTLYAKIKAVATENELSISEYLERLIDESVLGQYAGITRGHPVTLEAIERLRRLREKIAQEHQGQFFEDSAEILHQQREERMREQTAIYGFSSNEEGKPLS